MWPTGGEITPEILGGLAPIRTAHINRFEDYTLDFRQKTDYFNGIIGLGSFLRFY